MALVPGVAFWAELVVSVALVVGSMRQHSTSAREVRDKVGHCFIDGCLEIPLVDGLGEDTGEPFHQMADVSGVGNGIIAGCSKGVASSSVTKNYRI